MITGFVTREELELADLELHTGGYLIIDPMPGPGPVAWRRRTVQSPYVHGDTLVGATKEHGSLALSIAVTGASAAEIAARTSPLLRAFEQFSYHLGLSFDGVEYEWECDPADYKSGASGGFDLPTMRHGRWQTYSFVIPRNPTPVEGTH